MKVHSCVLLLLLATFAATAQNKSYPANFKKIKGIAFMASGCVTDHCYTWANVIMLRDSTLLEQICHHHPGGARSRFNVIGKAWIVSDTLLLDVANMQEHESHMHYKYRMMKMHDRLLLIPETKKDESDSLAKQIDNTFRQNFEFELNDPNFSSQIGNWFEGFIRDEYAAKYKLMVGEFVKEEEL